MRMCVTLLLLCVFASIATASDPIRIFIDQISEYHLLATCAELQLSTIVRNMAYVCGDGQKTTSYSCFCSASSAKVSSMIGKHVGTACVGDPAQSMSAIGVFDSYCQIGRSVQGQAASSVITTLSSPSLTAAPGSSPSTVHVTATASAVSAVIPEKSPVVPIAVGTSVAVVVLVSTAAAALVLSRRRKQNYMETIKRVDSVPPRLSLYQLDDAFAVAQVYELEPARSPVEIDGAERRGELRELPAVQDDVRHV